MHCCQRCVAVLWTYKRAAWKLRWHLAEYKFAKNSQLQSKTNSIPHYGMDQQQQQQRQQEEQQPLVTHRRNNNLHNSLDQVRVSMPLNGEMPWARASSRVATIQSSWASLRCVRRNLRVCWNNLRLMESERASWAEGAILCTCTFNSFQAILVSDLTAASTRGSPVQATSRLQLGPDRIAAC